MPQLFVVAGNLVGRTFAVEGAVVLGRAQDAGVRLPDASVSREHARIEPELDGGWSVVDLGSRNGVRVNGERVSRARLVDLDEIALGELVLRFRAQETEAPRRAADDAGGFELEEEIDLAATRATPRDVARARILAETRGGGPLSGDLEQWPWPLRWAAYLLALTAAAALCYAAFRLVQAVRNP